MIPHMELDFMLALTVELSLFFWPVGQAAGLGARIKLGFRLWQETKSRHDLLLAQDTLLDLGWHHV